MGGAACAHTRREIPTGIYLRSPPPSPCAMTEGSLRSYDPLAYYVNNVSDLDAEVVKAHRDNDEQKRKELLSRGKQDFDIICVNKHNHAFVLCVPCGPVDQTFGDPLSKDPFDVPDVLEVRAVLRERPAPDLQNTEGVLAIQRHQG